MVQVSFSDFQTEALYDTVSLCNGQYCDDTSRVASLSGTLSTSNRVYESDSNVLQIEMETDGNVGSSGFRATVSSVEAPEPVTGKNDLEVSI